MTRLIKYFIFIFAMCTISCTNEGDIGPLYGQWALRSLLVNGYPAQIDCDLYTFRFQGDKVMITKLLGHNDTEKTVGTFTHNGSVLTLNFSHHNETPGSENWDTFTPPAELGIPGDAVTPMLILELTSTDLVIQSEDVNNNQRIFSFQKLR